jgi:hypothetical protein
MAIVVVFFSYLSSDASFQLDGVVGVDVVESFEDAQALVEFRHELEVLVAQGETQLVDFVRQALAQVGGSHVLVEFGAQMAGTLLHHLPQGVLALVLLAKLKVRNLQVPVERK